jgi:hypothetical protein
VKCDQEIPLKRYPLYCFESFRRWYVDEMTGEAVMEAGDGSEIMRLYVPPCLINLSDYDLKILSKNHILHHAHKFVGAKHYEDIVKICIDNQIYA